MPNISFTHIKTAGLVLLLLSASACGQKGDLYLPGEEQAITQSTFIIHV